MIDSFFQCLRLDPDVSDNPLILVALLYAYKRASIRYLGRLKFLSGHFYSLIHKAKAREIESFIFSPQHRLYFYHALWPFIYFTHFLHRFFFKQLQPPPGILMVAP